VAIDDEGRPRGIFTLHDLLGRVTLGGVPLDRPLREVMTPDPATLDGEARGFAAALLMADRGFGHICITEGERLIGVLSEGDLFALRRLGLAHLRRDIGEAVDLSALAAVAEKVPALIEQMLAQGASVEQLTDLITALNDHVTRRAIELVLAEQGTPEVAFSWLGFGSEGRREQTLKTDQDNGILFQTPPGRTPDEVRAELLPLATRITEALSHCGLPLCTGGVMASNPEWCLSAEEWADKFTTWVNRADGKMLLYSSIFFDFRTLYGPEEPVEGLRHWLLGMVREHRNFFRRMVDNALGTRPPLGLLRNFVVKKGGDTPNTLDLKLNGITPFVDAGRICALYAGVSETNTARRLRAAAARWNLDEAAVDGWVEGFYFIQLLRLRRQREQLQRGEEPSNRIDPDRLNELERRVLKEAFRQARALQRQLEQFFQF
jgi:CBS domain-containing protein